MSWRRENRALALSVVLIVSLVVLAQSGDRSPNATVPSMGGFFSVRELRQFSALNPIDTHVHVYQRAPGIAAMLKRLNLHVLNITVNHSPDQKALDEARRQVLDFVEASNGCATLCTTFNAFRSQDKDFVKDSLAQINKDFDDGAVALKIWKDVGEKIKSPQGAYLMPDNLVLNPIYKEVAARNKTLIAHVADPNTTFEPPNPNAVNYGYYMSHLDEYMYNKPGVSKPAILRARDHVLESNPSLRVVGAHLGSMEANLKQLGQHLDRYPNFAVDLAARMHYLIVPPRAEMIAFIEKYQGRLLYATDNTLEANADVRLAVTEWQERYAFDWRFLATDETLTYRGKTIRGLALRPSVLRKIYHDNAIRWIPGVVPKAR